MQTHWRGFIRRVHGLDMPLEIPSEVPAEVPFEIPSEMVLYAE